MLNKKIIILPLILFTINFSIFASFGFDAGLNFDSDENTGSSEYPFSLVALPSFSSGKLAMELNLPIYFKIDSDLVTFDFSTFDLPENQNNFFDNALSYTEYFLSFINYVQWANFNENFALRVGKITNSTIGDGALLYHFKDENVTKFKTRPGLQVKLDGDMINFPAGIEFVSTDLYNPDLLGGRIFVEPIFFLDNNLLNKLTLGYTLMYNTRYNDAASGYWLNYVYDLQLPLFKNSSNSMITYYDLISEMSLDTDTDTLNRTLSQRVGIYGWYLTSFTYDMHIKNIIEDNAASYNFGKENWDLVSKTLIPKLKKDFIISGNTGYYSNNGLSKYIIGTELEINDLVLNNYNLTLEADIAKAIGPISSMYVTAKKTYFRDSITNEFSESFINGLSSLKNLDVNLSAQIVFYKINELTINYGIECDESGNIEPKFSFGYKFSLL